MKYLPHCQQNLEMNALLRLARLGVSGLEQQVAIFTNQVFVACISHVCQMAEALCIVLQIHQRMLPLKWACATFGW